MSAPRRNEDGVTAVEYSLVIALISLVVVGAAVSLGSGFVSWAQTVVATVGTLLS